MAVLWHHNGAFFHNSEIKSTRLILEGYITKSAHNAELETKIIQIKEP